MKTITFATFQKRLAEIPYEDEPIFDFVDQYKELAEYVQENFPPEMKVYLPGACIQDARDFFNENVDGADEWLNPQITYATHKWQVRVYKNSAGRFYFQTYENDSDPIHKLVDYIQEGFRISELFSIRECKEEIMNIIGYYRDIARQMDMGNWNWEF